MSRDAVLIVALQTKLDASERQARRTLHVLAAVARNRGLEGTDGSCWCCAWQNLATMAHTPECLSARRELLALPRAERCA